MLSGEYFHYFYPCPCVFSTCVGLRMDRAVGLMEVSTVFTSTAPWRSKGPEQRTRAPTPVWRTASWARLRTRSAWRSKVRHYVAVALRLIMSKLTMNLRSKIIIINDFLSLCQTACTLGLYANTLCLLIKCLIFYLLTNRLVFKLHVLQRYLSQHSM